jgi:putative flavoprotein involved in K+ transport
MIDLDVAVIGGGQAALAVGYYLRRTGLSYALLDEQEGPAGAWRHTWDSLTLFSPSQWSSLPGWLMPRTSGGYPSREEVIAYLAEYERRYELPVRRPVRVAAVRWRDGAFSLETSEGPVSARAVVSATGTWANPVVPDLPGQGDFRGMLLHSAHYDRPDAFVGRRVVVVGGGNSGAQIFAELSQVSRATWATLAPPSFLPDDVDGRVLFNEATARYRARLEGRPPPPAHSLGDIVMVPSVRAARDRGALAAHPMFERFTARGVVWPGGAEEHVDAVIWCTGFRPALGHLGSLGIVRPDGRVEVEGARAVARPGLWLVGYGDWTGFASATLIGVGRSARAAVDEVVGWLGGGTATR